MKKRILLGFIFILIINSILVAGEWQFDEAESRFLIDEDIKEISLSIFPKQSLKLFFNKVYGPGSFSYCSDIYRSNYENRPWAYTVHLWGNKHIVIILEEDKKTIKGCLFFYE